MSNSGRPTAMDDFDRGIEATVKALAGTALHPNEVKVINALRIKDIAARPDNRTCADCGAKGELHRNCCKILPSMLMYNGASLRQILAGPRGI